MYAYLWIGLGSALGGMARHWCSTFFAGRFSDTFPWGTVFVNVTGSFVIGFVSSLAAPEGRFDIPPTARLFLTVGLCGGYTTFSAFSQQTLVLLRNGETAAAGLNIGLSLVLCLVAVWLGHLTAMAANQFKGG
jgi:CrcB protein